ncbi:MAG: M15 family metallopeptidase [Pseudomonadota bacterium]
MLIPDYQTYEEVMPANFVYLRDVIPDVVEDVRYFSADNFVGERIPGYEAARLLITAEAASSLMAVQQYLQHVGLGLKVFDAYRPARAVKFFKEWSQNPQDIRKQAVYYPNLEKSAIFAAGYLVEFSSHSRGSTVDLTIIDASGAELDMGSCFDFFDLSSWTASQAVSAQQRANRLLLRSVMLMNNFIPVEEEWWHFTLKNEPYPLAWFDFPVR